MLLLALLASAASAIPLSVPGIPALLPPLPGSAVRVTLEQGIFTGKSTIQGINSFLSIPFAQPPVGDLRLRRALPVANSTKEFQATAFGPGCLQLLPTSTVTSAGIPASAIAAINGLPGYSSTLGESEDCLTLSVYAPSVTPAGGLPILFWIYGGGFEFGNSAVYDGNPVVARSIANGSPVVFVAVNYRLGGFGFLPGNAVKSAGIGNLGLSDQRLALEWVNANAAKFGGDASKVMLWGESAGAISVASQMLINGGQPRGLYRAAWMNSGSPIPAGPVDNPRAQAIYDTFLQRLNCSTAADTLACLRLVDVATYKNATTNFPRLTTFLPRADGLLLPQNPQSLTEQGLYAKIPIVTGDLTDEGTLFTIGVTAVTREDAKNYIRDKWVPTVTAAELEEITLAYPTDPAQGSPYDTGFLNQQTPVYKMLASFNGDLIFQAPRRLFLSFASKTQDTWSYAYDRTRDTPFLGAFHASELVEFILAPGLLGKFQPIDYVLNFANNLDPNVGVSKDLIAWPKWSVSSPVSIKFDNSLSGLLLIADTFRQAPMLLLNKLTKKYPI